MKTISLSPRPARLTLRSFCDLNGLTVTVYERDAETRAWGRKWNPIAALRYWAEVDGLELKGDDESSNHILTSPAGHGNTQRSALSSLTKAISGKSARGYYTGKIPKLVGVD